MSGQLLSHLGRKDVLAVAALAGIDEGPSQLGLRVHGLPLKVVDAL